MRYTAISQDKIQCALVGMAGSNSHITFLVRKDLSRLSTFDEMYNVYTLSGKNDTLTLALIASCTHSFALNRSENLRYRGRILEANLNLVRLLQVLQNEGP